MTLRLLQVCAYCDQRLYSAQTGFPLLTLYKCGKVRISSIGPWILHSQRRQHSGSAESVPGPLRLGGCFRPAAPWWHRWSVAASGSSLLTARGGTSSSVEAGKLNRSCELWVRLETWTRKTIIIKRRCIEPLWKWKLWLLSEDPSSYLCCCSKVLSTSVVLVI